MSQNLSTEEVETILDLTQPKGEASSEIATRDFRRPMRLSLGQLDRQRLKLEKCLPEIDAAFTAWLRRPHKASLAALTEIDAYELLASLAEPMCVVCFESAGQPAWMVWESSAAVAGAELALGTSEVKAPDARKLSSIERKLLTNLLTRVTGAVATSLGVESKGFQFAQDVEALKPSREAIGAGDPQRLCAQISIESGDESSVLRIYLPGVCSPDATSRSVTAAAGAKPAARAPLPRHLADVSVDLHAELGSTELPLSELLGLEVGDVILLDVQVGSALDVYIEGEACATARFGDHDGRLAIQIDALGPRDRTT